MAKNRTLSVAIEHGEVVIRIGVNALRVAAEGSEDFNDSDGPRCLRVFDPDRFAAGVVDELNAESEDGTTHVHEMFDKAFRKAVDNGTAGGCEIVAQHDVTAAMKKHPDKPLAPLLLLMLAAERREAKAKAISEGTYP